jgi:hypothetical protein
MAQTCRTPGCKTPIPPEIAKEGYCLLHFTLRLEQVCSELRRETVSGSATAARNGEIVAYIADQGEMLARVSTSGLHLADELKSRVLSTFLTLMNLRESLDRAALRAVPHRTVVR